MSVKIVTVTLNPALDMTGSLSSLQRGEVNLIDKAHLNPGGKGINVAKVLAELGAEVSVTGFLGDENQDSFRLLFNQLGINDAFVRVAGSSRINVKLVEQNGDVTDLNFPGIQVNEEQVSALEHTLFELAQDHELIVIAGSLPRGFTTERLVGWISKLRQLGKKVIFDSSNAALTAGLQALPWLIKPNDDELSQWAGKKLATQAQLLAAGHALAATGVDNVVISRGSQGVLWLKDGQWLRSQPPKMQVVSTVGAGDTLVAGMCWAELNQWDRAHALRFATALSALAVTQVNVGVTSLAQVNAIEAQVSINTIENDFEAEVNQ